MAEPTEGLTELELIERMVQVLALHHEYRGVCAHCVDSSNPPVHREAWPCETVKILTQEDPMDDRDDEPIQTQDEGRPGPDQALKYLIAEAFADTRTLRGTLQSYIAYVTGWNDSGADFAVLDTTTEQVRHFTLTIEEQDPGEGSPG